jgi:hypothetical protein
MNASLIIAAVLLFAATCASAQTKIIAHRSHSGADATLTFAGEDNFGLGPPRIIKVIKVCDSAAIIFTDHGSVDTVRGRTVWYDPAVGLDSLRAMFPFAKFIGFGAEDDGEEEEEMEEVHGDIPQASRGERRADAVGADPADDPAPLDMSGWLLALGAVATPLLTYSIWRAEKGRKA